MSPTQFRHTQYAVYITALATALAAGYDSCQGIVQKYHINKKWFYLYGFLMLFAYLYVRPLIRKRLGSASSAYINWNTVYAMWLCAAVFYHMPSFESLGFDIKADVSIMLTIFLMSCALLGVLASTYGFLTSIRSVSKRLLYIPPTSKEIFSVVVLNSMNLALACSTYYSFCGNSPEYRRKIHPDDSFRNYVCSDLLRPISSHQYQIFSRWVIYGEGENTDDRMISKNTTLTDETAVLMDGYISPVFTTWLTLFFLFLCNSFADFVAAYFVRCSTVSTYQRSGSSRLKRKVSGKRGGKENGNHFVDEAGSFGSLSELDFLWNSATITGPLKTVSSFFNAKGDERDEDDVLPSMIVGRKVPDHMPSPNFLPMFPWYSGTSADLLNTLIDLIVSVKVFVGRFDMRTMLSATPFDRTAIYDNDFGPSEGDGYTFEHLSQKKELWLDFCADTGDGGNSTYSIARCLAAKRIFVNLPEGLAEQEGETGGRRMLPRGDTLIHGGDLAYPNPTDETYETRLFKPYEDAFQSPPHVYSGHLVVNKPDLPMQYYLSSMEKCLACSKKKQEESCGSPCKMCMKVQALRSYQGPTSFMIPGNHDWIDGLETFQRNIIHRGWIGGWLLPQEKSYFALKLPHGWWLFGIDLALEEDIDMCQYRYFAKIAEERMESTDRAVIVTHCPQWLVDWFWGHGEESGKILRQLIRGPLRGKVKLRLAGDLHFYMRHSFKRYGSEGVSVPPSYMPTPAGGSPIPGGSPRQRNGHPIEVLSKKSHAQLVSKLTHIAKKNGERSTDEDEFHPRSISVKQQTSTPPKLGSVGSTTPVSLEGSSPPNWWPGLKVKSPLEGSSPSQQLSEKLNRDSEWEAPPPGWVLNDAEHLVVCGSGGAFLHPTHVFSYARFRPLHDPSAGPIHVRPTSMLKEKRSFPSSSSLYSMRKSDGPKPSAGGEYQCITSFPTADDSFKIGRQNLHAFRNVNSRFDIIGGVVYYLLVLSALPRCSEVAQIFNATSPSEAVEYFLRGIGSTFLYIFSESYVSFFAFFLLFLVVYGFARGGGVGAIHGVAPAARRKPEYRGFALAVKARMGGLSAQLIYSSIHALLHLTMAIALLLLLEVGIETVIRYENVGSDGYHSLYRWYRQFERSQFPDPANLRSILSYWTFGLYPNAIKWLFAVFDIPEAIAVSRSATCAAGGSIATLTRLQTFGYYIGVLLYFWVLATPTVGLIFGLYLYISGNWLHVHYDESFSALQVEDRKAFLRLHIDSSGNLEVYSLGLRDVPREWREDPRWKSHGGGAFNVDMPHEAEFPSRWMPVKSQGRGKLQFSKPPEDLLEVVDYLKISKSE